MAFIVASPDPLFIYTKDCRFGWALHLAFSLLSIHIQLGNYLENSRPKLLGE